MIPRSSTVSSLDCKTCGSAMELRSPLVGDPKRMSMTAVARLVRVWVCTKDARHPRVIPGFEKAEG